MTFSLNGIKQLMRRTIPGKKVSDDAARLLKVYLERKAEDLTIHAARIHDRENTLRSQLGERQKVILSPRHMRMAIDGKYPDLEGSVNGRSEH